MPKFKHLTTYTPKLKYLLGILFFSIIMTLNAQAANHALLIGIGVYPGLPKSNQLEGPPYDVTALAQVLQTYHGFESADIRTLVNAQAGRSAILNALNALKHTTRPGDFIFVYFSGHGTSSYDPSKKKWGIDPYTGALMPADFKFSRSVRDMMARLIIGKRDLRPILQELEQKRLLFVAADACYSGNAVRSMEKRRYKYVPLPQDDLFADETPAPYSSAATPEPLYPYNNVVYLSAASRREKAEDITQDQIWYADKKTVDGKPHGAMTDALLRALQSSGADTDNDGGITADELYHYVKTRTARHFLQTPQQLAPPNNPDLRTMALFKTPGQSAASTSDNPAALLRVKLGDGAQSLKKTLAAIRGLTVSTTQFDIKVVKAGNGYDLYLASGALLATVPQGGADAVSERLRRQVQVKELAGFTYPHQRFNVSVDLIGNKGVLIENDQIGFFVRSQADAYILLLNIDTAGNINVIYPYKLRELTSIQAGADKKWDNMGKVAPPWFGTEYIKVFAFKKQPAALKDFVGAEFAPNDPRLGALMRMLKNAEGQAAQMTLMVKTCREEDIDKD